MSLAKLGYTEKWIRYKFIDEAIFKKQFDQFKEDSSFDTTKLRYSVFMKWIESKETFTNREVKNFLELARHDEDIQMAGTALKELFLSPKISSDQFEMLVVKLPEFGPWTQKLIRREVLLRKLESEPITFAIYKRCLAYKNDFSDSRPLIAMIKKTEDEEILADFEGNDCGKKIKTLALNKLSQVKRASK